MENASFANARMVIEEAIGQLRTILREQDTLEKDMAIELKRHREIERALEEPTRRINEWESRLDSAKRRDEEKRKRFKGVLTMLVASLEDLRESDEGECTGTASNECTMTVVPRTYAVYSTETLAMATDNFSESKVLGGGRYGRVYKGELQNTPVAIKVLYHEPGTAPGLEDFEREVEFLSTLHHPYMAMILGACLEKPCIVYEYLPNGNLEDRLLRKGAGGIPPLPWYVRFKICVEVSLALHFLHCRRKPIVHGYLNLSNILLDHDYVTTLSNVGIYKPQLSTQDGECERMDISPQTDVNAFGKIILQLLTGRFHVCNEFLIERAINDQELSRVLDRTAGDWPIEKATELAQLALRLLNTGCPNLYQVALRIVNLLSSTYLAAMASPSATYS